MCRRGAAASRHYNELAAKFEGVSVFLASFESRRRDLTRRRALALLLAAAGPLLFVSLLLAAYKFKALRRWVAPWQSLEALALCIAPTAIGLTIASLARAQLSRLTAKHAAKAAARAGLIARVKKELPMQEALQLLLKYDPKGDHRGLIAVPPEVTAELAAQRAAVAELAVLLDGTLGLLRKTIPGGTSGCAAAMVPAMPLLMKHASRLPAAGPVVSAYEALRDSGALSPASGSGSVPLLARSASAPSRTMETGQRTSQEVEAASAAADDDNDGAAEAEAEDEERVEEQTLQSRVDSGVTEMPSAAASAAEETEAAAAAADEGGAAAAQAAGTEAEAEARPDDSEEAAAPLSEDESTPAAPASAESKKKGGLRQRRRRAEA